MSNARSRRARAASAARVTASVAPRSSVVPSASRNQLLQVHERQRRQRRRHVLHDDRELGVRQRQQHRRGHASAQSPPGSPAPAGRRRPRELRPNRRPDPRAAARAPTHRTRRSPGPAAAAAARTRAQCPPRPAVGRAARRQANKGFMRFEVGGHDEFAASRVQGSPVQRRVAVMTAGAARCVEEAGAV